MTRPLIPPRYVNVPPSILFNEALPDGAKVFYGQVRALAWQSAYKSTPPLTMEELEAITGRKKTAIYGYMTTLRITTALLWHTSGSGQFIFSFPEPVDSAIPESPIHCSSSSESITTTEILTEEEQEQRKPEIRTPVIPEIRKAESPPGPINEAAHQALLAANVREPKAAQLAALPWVTEEYVKEHVRLAVRVQGHPIGTAIWRIANEWPLEETATRSEKGSGFQVGEDHPLAEFFRRADVAVDDGAGV